PSSLAGVAANALPTYPEPAAEAPAEPVKLKKFTRSQTRAARRAHTRKAMLAQRARGSKLAKETEQTVEDSRAKSTDKSTKRVGLPSANAELVDASINKDAWSSSDKASALDKASASDQAQAVATEAQAAGTQPAKIELVAAEELNDVDRAAWDTNQMPRLM